MGSWRLKHPRWQLVPARGNRHLTRLVKWLSGSKLGQLSLLLGLLLLVMLLLELLQCCRIEWPPGLQSLHVMCSLGRHLSGAMRTSLLVLQLLLLLH